MKRNRNRQRDPLGDKPSTSQPIPENWVKRNSYWLWPCIMLFLAIIGWVSGFGERVFNDAVNSRIDNKLAPTNEKFNGLTSRLSTVEGKIDAILAMKHIDQVGMHVEQQDTIAANAEASAALISLIGAKSVRASIPREYFNESVAIINAATEKSQDQRLRDQLHKILLTLAEYRSAIEPEPDLSGPKKTIDTSIRTSLNMRMNVRILFGATIFPVYVHGELFISSAPPKLSSNVVIDGPAVFVGMVPDASQTLDGIHWLNGVTFVNMTIRYMGGELNLQNVRFVNCIFDFSHNQQTNQFASALATHGQPFTFEQLKSS